MLNKILKIYYFINFLKYFFIPKYIDVLIFYLILTLYIFPINFHELLINLQLFQDYLLFIIYYLLFMIIFIDFLIII